MKKSHSLNIRMEAELIQELTRLAKAEGRSVGAMARWSMMLGLKDLNKMVRLRAQMNAMRDRE